uniref:Putative secreted peptide n=1 Tax=Anopheles braziliensis TaxID=58242 RepID=A0A2M3ZSJ0_9DIPT
MLITSIRWWSSVRTSFATTTTTATIPDATVDCWMTTGMLHRKTVSHQRHQRPDGCTIHITNATTTSTTSVS